MRFLVIILLFLFAENAHTQGRGAKIGYIDMEYILKSAPDYLEAKNLLDKKAQQWKQEVDTKKSVIETLKEKLKSERVLLTKELIEEREEEISYLEKELNDYQLKRFGPTGDLVMQKAVLVQPVQDQVFTILQDIAVKQKYDFILDKSSDLSLIFAAKRYDLSDRVIKALGRVSKREKLSKKQLDQQLANDAKEDFIDENPDLVEKEKEKKENLDAKRKEYEDRKKAAKEKADLKRKQFADKKEKMLQDKRNKNNGTVSDKTKKTTSNNEDDKPKEE